MTTPQILQYIYSFNPLPPDFPRYLDWLTQSDQQEHYLSDLQGPELTRLVDFLDWALGIIPITDEASRRCLHKLQAICSDRAILPSSYIISGGLSRIGDCPVASGGLADVWEGTYGGIGVCIKYPRINRKDRLKIEKAFHKEAVMWKGLKHQNVVSFIGVTLNPLQFVSEWMPNGTLGEYLESNPGANRIGLLTDVADGLAYLHVGIREERGTAIPMDVNPKRLQSDEGWPTPSILIDSVGRARLADFGFASTVRGLNSILVTKVQGFTPRWTAPEVIRNGDRCTQEADVFSFAMVVIEVFTGTSPFSGLTDTLAIQQIIYGGRPSRPQGQDLTDPIWYMTTRCWQEDPLLRPKMMEVVTILRERCATISAPQWPVSHDHSRKSGVTVPELGLLAATGVPRYVFLVRVEYGNTGYETLPTGPSLTLHESSWFSQPCFWMETNTGNQIQSIFLKLLHRVPGRDILYATGNFSLFGNIGKGFPVRLDVQGSAASVTLNVRLDAV